MERVWEKYYLCRDGWDRDGGKNMTRCRCIRKYSVEMGRVGTGWVREGYLHKTNGKGRIGRGGIRMGDN